MEGCDEGFGCETFGIRCRDFEGRSHGGQFLSLLSQADQLSRFYRRGILWIFLNTRSKFVADTITRNYRDIRDLTSDLIGPLG